MKARCSLRSRMAAASTSSSVGAGDEPPGVRHGVAPRGDRQRAAGERAGRGHGQAQPRGRRAAAVATSSKVLLQVPRRPPRCVASIGSTSMKRNICTLTDSSCIAQAMIRSSHQRRCKTLGWRVSQMVEQIPADLLGRPLDRRQIAFRKVVSHAFCVPCNGRPFITYRTPCTARSTCYNGECTKNNYWSHHETGGKNGTGHWRRHRSGPGIALALGAEGCRVAIAGRREDKLKEVAALHKGSTPVLTHPCDVADRKSVEKLFEWADKQLGQLDIMVNSAGINVRKRTFADMLPEEFDQVLGVNAVAHSTACGTRCIGCGIAARG